MQQLADNTYRLGTRGHSFYVVRDGDACTVIDAGCSREWKKLSAGLESIGLSIGSVAGIVATHAHSDHFGLAERALKSGLSVAVHDDEVARATGAYKGRFSASTSDLPKFNIHALRNFIPMIFAGVRKLDFVEQVSTFSDGERLDLPGSPVVVHTPGHTEGHTMFHLPELGALFTGDGLITMDLLGSGRGPQMIGEVFNLDHKVAIASLDRIAGLDASVIYPGHGDPWNGSPAEAVSLARSS